MAKLSEVTEGAKTKIYSRQPICRRCVRATLRTVKLGLRVGIEQNHWRILKKKKLFFVPVYSRCSNVWSPTCGCLWRDCSQYTVKRPHQISAFELIVLALCCACSLQMYQFPIGYSWHQRTYNNLDTLYLENAYDNSSVLPHHCHMLHCTPSECRWVQPRWSTPCLCWFDYSTHTCEILSLFFETNDSPSMPQGVWERVDVCTAHVSFCCIIFGCVSRLVAVNLNVCSKLVWNATLSYFLYLFIFFFF